MNNEEKERHTFDGMEPVVKSVSVKKPQSFFGERPLTAIEMAPRVLRYQSRRDFLVFGAGALAALAGAGFVLPQQTLSRMGMPRNMDSPGKERFLKQSTAYRRRRCRGSVLWNSQGTDLHQIADYLAQEQLQRSYS